jgi:acetyl esterase/lipase
MKQELNILFCLTLLALSSCTPQTTNPINNIEKSIIDTSYGTQSANKMDLYLPINRNSNTPVIILIHGGAWESGDKSDMNVIVNNIKQKWPEAAIANINYRLTNDPTVHHTEIMNDVKAAVNFIVSYKTNFNISDKLFMTGASVGGQLALLYTYKFNSNNLVRAVGNYFGVSRVNDLSYYNSTTFNGPVKPVIDKYMNVTAFDGPLFATTSPYDVVIAGNKPTISFHGTWDGIVGTYHSTWLKARLDSLNVPNQYHEYLDNHGFTPENYTNSVEKMVLFFKNYN